MRRAIVRLPLVDSGSDPFTSKYVHAEVDVGSPTAEVTLGKVGAARNPDGVGSYFGREMAPI